MKNDSRKFKPGVLIHCYQNTIEGYLLFYTISDYLVYFTILCVLAIKHEITVAALCQMPDHVHSSLMAKSLRSLSLFIKEVSFAYSKAINSLCKRKGGVFNRRFGSALKEGGKKARSNIIYIGNNPVERKLVEKAEDYRWNYLAYAKSKHPFSKRISVRKASSGMKKAMKEVKGCFNRKKALSYNQLQRMFSKLDRQEKLQLTDFIITTYSVIDYGITRQLFGSVEDAIAAMHSNTGNEYDIQEEFTGRTDTHYANITAAIMRSKNVADIHDILALPEPDRQARLRGIVRELKVPAVQAAKYLRIPRSKIDRYW